jgi:hypothetical protein
MSDLIKCDHCLDTGRYFTHAEDCRDDLCALNGDMHSCAGQVMRCDCPAGTKARREICPGCKGEIDPDWCWCGGHMDRHTMGDGHSPVPMGCVCHYDATPAPAEPPVSAA